MKRRSYESLVFLLLLRICANFVDGQCSAVPENGCSVCGDDICIGNPDPVFEFPGQPAVTCGILQGAGYVGQIPLDQCFFLPPLVADLCECGDQLGTTAAPVTSVPATPAPTRIPPTTVASITLAPATFSPITLAPATNAPITLAPATNAPITMTPVTSAPITPIPATGAPITLAPTTVVPTTPAPTPVAPVMSPEATPVSLPPTTAAPEIVIPPVFAALITNREERQAALRLERDIEREERREERGNRASRRDIFDRRKLEDVSAD